MLEKAIWLRSVLVGTGLLLAIPLLVAFLVWAFDPQLSGASIAVFGLLYGVPVAVAAIYYLSRSGRRHRLTKAQLTLAFAAFAALSMLAFGVLVNNSERRSDSLDLEVEAVEPVGRPNP